MIRRPRAKRRGPASTIRVRVVEPPVLRYGDTVLISVPDNASMDWIENMATELYDRRGIRVVLVPCSTRVHAVLPPSLFTEAEDGARV